MSRLLPRHHGVKEDVEVESSSASIATVMEFSTRKKWKVYQRVFVVVLAKLMPMAMA
jgi:hypothetical protein